MSPNPARVVDVLAPGGWSGPVADHVSGRAFGASCGQHWMHAITSSIKPASSTHANIWVGLKPGIAAMPVIDIMVVVEMPTRARYASTRMNHR